MDFWTIVLIAATVIGMIIGIQWAFINAIYWLCEWRDGNPLNWGWEAVCAFGVPCAWIFALVEIAVLYWSK